MGDGVGGEGIGRGGVEGRNWGGIGEELKGIICSGRGVLCCVMG